MITVQNAVRCFNHDVAQHLRIIKADLKEDFWKWRADVRADFQLLLIELRRDIIEFDIKFHEFKLAVEGAVGVAVGITVGATVAAIDWTAWELRFHIALIWEAL